MFTIISPSKTQDFSRDFSQQVSEKDCSPPFFPEETEVLVNMIKTKSTKNLETLMNISPQLAEKTAAYFQNWNRDFTQKDISVAAKQQQPFSPAIFAFSGAVYKALEHEKWKRDDFLFANKHLGILSGLYGLLSPLTSIKPYRLEMGTRLCWKTAQRTYENLYEYWREKITDTMNAILQKESAVINLASQEYSKVINPKKRKGIYIDVDFKVLKNGTLKTIGIFAKRARGHMVSEIITKRIQTPEDIKKFSKDHWKYQKTLSSPNTFVFVKEM